MTDTIFPEIPMTGSHFFPSTSRPLKPSYAPPYPVTFPFQRPERSPDELIAFVLFFASNSSILFPFWTRYFPSPRLWTVVFESVSFGFVSGMLRESESLATMSALERPDAIPERICSAYLVQRSVMPADFPSSFIAWMVSRTIPPLSMVFISSGMSRESICETGIP